MKVFQLNECDYWVGETLEACIAAAKEEWGETCFDEVMDRSEPCELDEKAMNILKFHDENGETRTFAEQLTRDISEGGKFPRCFASSEY